jgi:hypothetical protein
MGKERKGGMRRDSSYGMRMRMKESMVTRMGEKGVGVWV